ncbi:class I SAM-dependent methyltransferase [Actinocrispum sp. NPDC049592]|uniref:class I SAM-dependent methyltransferase n=1 Tax=Actinocrispum sp. NPDC049592 TaxID=3154835 RepID=UPI00341794D2
MMDKVELLRAMPAINRPLQWLERHPTLHGLVLAAFGLRRPIFVDHRVRPLARPEHPGITAMIEKNRASYADRLTGFVELADQLAKIPVYGSRDGHKPYWDNGWLPALDAIALYGLLAERNPKRYLEIGSGNSTKFARRAIGDHCLRTAITSIDPHPRAQVDLLCDNVIRDRLEDTDVEVFAGLEAGDIVFLDGSHRVFTGSDVTVFFFEILPLLRPGVLVHIHDIALPKDYPLEWRYRYYSEQYLLAAFLLAEPARFDVVLPNAFVDGDEQLRSLLDPLWPRIGFTEKYKPTSFWLEVR